MIRNEQTTNHKEGYGRMRQDRLPPKPRRAWLLNACAWYTALTALILIVNLLMGGADKALQPLQCLLFLPLGLCLSGAGLLRRAPLRGGVYAVCHALATVGGIFLFGFLPYILRGGARPSYVLIFLLLSLCIWGVAFAVFSVRDRREQSRARDAQPYQSQFGKRGR